MYILMTNLCIFSCKYYFEKDELQFCFFHIIWWWYILSIKIKKLIISILIPLGLGTLVGLLTSPNNSDIIMPSFAPPAILFPIVWSILYILMGISNYIITESDNLQKDKAISIYKLQLIVNLLWSFIFFTFKLYFISFLWIILLIILVIIKIKRFYDISKVSGLLQLPYLLWLIFASILNLSIFILNWSIILF